MPFVVTGIAISDALSGSRRDGPDRQKNWARSEQRPVFGYGAPAATVWASRFGRSAGAPHLHTISFTASPGWSDTTLV